MRHTQMHEINAWMRNLKQLVKTKTCSAPEFCRPFHFISLALALKAQGARHFRQPDSLMGYACRMHLLEAIGLPQPS